MRQPLNVTTLNLYAKRAIEQFEELQELVVIGEISGFTRHYKSGHCYFTLKDERSSIKTVMFARQAALLGFQPQDGMQVIVYGRVSIYERDGAFQLYADYLRPAGIGTAQKAFDMLKEKLSREGLFDAQFKKPIPAMPEYIGVVTSKTGAALQDILNVVGRRWPGVKLLLAPVSVQGLAAEQDVVRGIRALEADGRADVILVARGGGSREDLWVFNSEQIARAAFACKIPLVSAVGHEIDYTILDYVADLRAPTPSAAAELCVPDREEWQKKIQYLAENMQKSIQKKLQVCYNELERCDTVVCLRMHKQAIQRKQTELDRLTMELREKMNDLYIARRQQLSAAAALAQSLSPYGVLARGYTYVERRGTLTELLALKAGDGITVVGAQARAQCIVEKVEPTEAAK